MGVAVPPARFACESVSATSPAYSLIVAALRSRLGFVVASRGLYFWVLAKSPVSATTRECCLSAVSWSVMARPAYQSAENEASGSGGEDRSRKSGWIGEGPSPSGAERAV